RVGLGVLDRFHLVRVDLEDVLHRLGLHCFGCTRNHPVELLGDGNGTRGRLLREGQLVERLRRDLLRGLHLCCGGGGGFGELLPHEWGEGAGSWAEIWCARTRSVRLRRAEEVRVDLVQPFEEEVPANCQPQRQQEEDAQRPVVLNRRDDEREY